MILYTMMPHELIFPVQEQDYEQTELVSYQGVPLLVEKTEDYGYRVIRVVSTDPQHYLNDQFCPGTKISF
jgi:hypothetical protein